MTTPRMSAAAPSDRDLWWNTFKGGGNSTISSFLSGAAQLLATSRRFRPFLIWKMHSRGGRGGRGRRGKVSKLYGITGSCKGIKGEAQNAMGLDGAEDRGVKVVQIKLR